MVHVKILADRMPIVKNGRTVGAVAIFRNRTEMVRLAENLTGVNHVVEALRANTHEFMNKLHVILGLLQLEEYKEAERYVLELPKVRPSPWAASPAAFRSRRWRRCSSAN